MPKKRRHQRITTKPIRRNARGWRVGEDHGKAKLSDFMVNAMRRMHKPGVRGYGYESCGKAFGVSPWTARDILTYRTRVPT